MHIAQNIKHLRKAKGITQGELAEMIEKVPTTISDYEKGKTVPPLDIALQLGDIFGVSLDDLVKRDLASEGLDLSGKALHGGSTASPQSQELAIRLLALKLKDMAREIKEKDEELYEKIGLEELVRVVSGM